MKVDSFVSQSGCWIEICGIDSTQDSLERLHYRTPFYRIGSRTPEASFQRSDQLDRRGIFLQASDVDLCPTQGFSSE